MPKIIAFGKRDPVDLWARDNTFFSSFSYVLALINTHVPPFPFLPLVVSLFLRALVPTTHHLPRSPPS